MPKTPRPHIYGMSQGINHHRRRFLGTAAMTLAATQLGLFSCVDRQSSQTKSANLPTIKPGTNTSFGSLKQIDAGLLNVGYAEVGPTDAPVVMLLHGWRLGLAEGEPKYDDLEKRLAAAPVITVLTITLEGDANGAPHPDPSAYARKFSGKYLHRTIQGGIGHNLPQEAPQAFAKAVIEVDRY
jgi:hypothetical protein